MTGEHERTDMDLREPLFDGLGKVAAHDPARRAALVERVVAAQAGARRPRILFLSGGALAAAAAVVLAVLAFWPERGPAFPPTEIFAYLLGPLTEMTATAVPAPAVQQEGSAADAVLGAVWSDLEGPLAIGMDALEAPQTLVSVPSARPQAPVNQPAVRKEK